MVSGQDRSSSGAYPVFGAVAEFARSCAKSRRCRRGDRTEIYVTNFMKVMRIESMSCFILIEKSRYFW